MTIAERPIAELGIKVVVGEPRHLLLAGLGTAPGVWTVRCATPASTIAGTVETIGADRRIGWPVITRAMVGQSWGLYQDEKIRVGGRMSVAHPDSSGATEDRQIEVVLGDETVVQVTVVGDSRRAEDAADRAEVAAEEAEGHSGTAGAHAGQAGLSATAAAGSATAAGVAETEAEAHRLAAAGSELAAAGSAGAAAVSAAGAAGAAHTVARALIDSVSARAAVAPLFSPFDPADPLSGPVAAWLADFYVPGVAGGPGRYPNLAGTGPELDLLEPATAAHRPLRLPFAGVRYASFPGVNGNHITTPHQAGDATITTELDVIVRIENYQHPDSTSTLMNKGDSGSTMAWWLRAEGGGGVRLLTSSDGVTTNASAVGTTLTPGFTGHLRCRWRGSDGRIQFHTSTDYDPVTGIGTWAQLGADRVGVVGSLFASTDVLSIGARPNGASPWPGRLGYAEARATDGGAAVATWRAADMGQTGGVSGGRTWTVRRSLGNNARSVVVDRTVALFDGVDDYLEVPHDPRLDPVGGALTVVHVYRAWGSPATTSSLVTKNINSTGPGWSLYRLANGAVVARTNGDTAQGSDPGTGLMVAIGAWSASTLRGAFNGLRASRVLAAAAAGVLHPLTIGRYSNTASGHSSQEWVGTFVFQRPTADSENESVTNGLVGRPDIQVERIDIDPVAETPNRSGFGTLSAPAAGGILGGGYRRSTGDTQWIEFPATLSAGTWRIDLMHTRSVDAPILRVTLDGVSLGTVNTYAAATTHNVNTAFTPINVTTPGRKVLRIAVEGRDAANTTGYGASLQKISLVRTA